MELTKSELEIMDVLWNKQVPLSRSDLLTDDSEKGWKDSSIHILLNGLLQKGAIREAGFVRCSKTYGRTFEPTLTREEYRYLESLFGGKPEFTATYRDHHGEESTFRAYRSGHSITVRNARTGLYKNYKLTLIEC